jgi:hypothetical protein
VTDGPFSGLLPAFAPPSFNGKPSYIDVVAPWVHPQERLHAVLRVRLCGMIRHRVPRRHRPVKPARSKPMGPLHKAVAMIVMPLSVLLNLGGAAAEFLSATLYAFFRALVIPLRGRPLKGGWSSQAGQFVISVRTGPSYTTGYDNERTLMAFTDRRVLLVHDGARGAESLGEFGREQLHQAEIRHWTFSNRVDLYFADGSLAAAEVTTPQAEALQALSRGELPAPWPGA